MVKSTSRAFSSCILFLAITGILQGELESQKKLLFFFDKIEVDGNVDVFLIKGKRLREATIYADSEIISSIKAEVSRKTLFIDANNTYNIARRLPFIKLKAERTYPVEIVISIDEIREIRLLGQSNLTAQNLSIIHEGDGDILLKGREVRELKVKISDNGSLYADELEVDRATLIHQGNGIVHLNPKHWLDARIHGSGNLFLHATPENLVIDKQGSGSVKDILPDSPPLYDLNATIQRFKKL